MFNVDLSYWWSSFASSEDNTDVNKIEQFPLNEWKKSSPMSLFVLFSGAVSMEFIIVA